MSKFVYPITSFSSGELSPNLFGRIDVREYSNGMSLTKNALLNTQGGVKKRIGSKARSVVGGGASLRDSVNALEFTISDGSSVIVEFSLAGGLLYIRLLDSDFNEISYTGAPIAYHPDLSGFNGVAFGNRIFITHYSGTLQPIYFDLNDISNVTASNFYYGNFKSTPFQDVNTDINTKVRFTDANTVGPSYTLIANQNIFKSGHVGSQIMITGITKVETINGADLRDVNVVNSMTYFITSYVSDTEVTVVPFVKWSNPTGLFHADVTLAPLGTPTTLATSQWFDEFAFSSFSAEAGHPKIFGVFENRLLVGGTQSQQDTIFASKINEPFIFQDKRFATKSTDIVYRLTGGDSHSITFDPAIYDGDIEDTDPYQFTIASKDAAPISFFEYSRFGVIGTYNRQLFIDGGGSIVSQRNVGIRPFATKSSSPLLSVAVDNTVFYADGRGTKVYMYLYNETNGSYISRETTLLFDGFNDDDKIVIMKYSREFDAVMCITSSGNVVALSYTQSSDVLGFTRFYTAVPNAKVVDFITSRDSNGNDRSVAIMDTNDGKLQYHTFDNDILLGWMRPKLLDRQDEFQYIDRLIVYDDELGTDTVTQLERFVNETIYIYATDDTDIDVYEILHDGSPSYVLPKTYKGFAIGVKYSFEMATMPIEAGQNGATAQLGTKRIDKALIRTAGCDTVEVGTDGYNYEERDTTENKTVLSVTGNSELDHRIFIRHDKPGPCMINNMTVRGVSNDG